MNTISRSITQHAWRYAALGLTVAGVLAFATLTSARMPYSVVKTVIFEESEGGVLHYSVTADGHQSCSVGVNDSFGHYTRTIWWSSVTSTLAKGRMECKFDSGAVLYGDVTLTTPSEEGVRHISVLYSFGTGSLAYTMGSLGGTLESTSKKAGVETYTGHLKGQLHFLDPRVPQT